MERQPVQDRSKRTLEAILSATEELLKDRSFEEVSIAEIIVKAGSSTGSFYARFDSKEAQLPALYARYHQALPERIERARKAHQRRPHTLAETCRRVVEAFAASFEERPNLMRAIALFARKQEGEMKPYLGERAQMLEGIADLFEPHVQQIRRRDAKAAIRTGLFFAGTVIREGMLFPKTPAGAAAQLSHAKLKAEAAAMLLAYLTMEDAP
jgi:AcrR family transcriptional regulator